MSCTVTMIGKIALVFICALASAQDDDSQPPPSFAGPRIVGGYKVSDRSQFPYQVSVRLRNQHFCGGTIIDENHILTAAHCCYDKEGNLLPAKSLTVVAGDLNIRKSTASTVEKQVRYVFPHSSYNPSTIANDIAVLRIKVPYESWNANVLPLTLSTSLPSAVSPCTVSGWGTLNSGDDVVSADLYAADIFTIGDDVCKNSYGNKIRSGMFCAGQIRGGIDSCQGDSGGPLAHNNVLVGIVSWGFECAKPGYPGVYTDVSKFSKWISTQQTRASSGTYVISTLTIITAMILHLLRFE